MPVEEEMAAHPVFLPGKPQGQRSLLGHSPRGRKESDTTERLSSSEPDQHGGAAGADSRPRGRLESGDTRGSWPAGAAGERSGRTIQGRRVQAASPRRHAGTTWEVEAAPAKP